MDGKSSVSERCWRIVKDQPPLRILGERIRATRKALGWSQEKLAFKAEIDRSYIGGVERGERNLSFLTLCQIAATLGSDVGALTFNLPRKPRGS